MKSLWSIGEKATKVAVANRKERSGVRQVSGMGCIKNRSFAGREADFNHKATCVEQEIYPIVSYGFAQRTHNVDGRTGR